MAVNAYFSHMLCYGCHNLHMKTTEQATNKMQYNCLLIIILMVTTRKDQKLCRIVPEIVLDCQTSMAQRFELFACWCRLMITFANRLDTYKAKQNVGPDLGPNCLTL